jgi:UDP-galactopyranose mutase
MYDCLVVGAGFCGSVLAAELARKLHLQVLVVEKRPHIAGNMYDAVNEAGILVQHYGPHAFHTNNQAVFDYLCQYSNFKKFELRCKVMVQGKAVPSPFNLQAIDLLFTKAQAAAIKQALRKEYGNLPHCGILDLLKSDNALIREYARYLFEQDYKPYTLKQWGLKPEDLDISILQRVPVLFTNEDRYFTDRIQALPAQGYTELFKNMLRHVKIKVALNTYALEKLTFDQERQLVAYPGLKPGGLVIFTGAVDSLFKYRFGALPYRSLKFVYKTLPQDSYQTAPLVAYPLAKGYTRITEYKKLPEQNIPGRTTIAIEYPLQYDAEKPETVEPYYPILNAENQAQYALYAQEAQKYTNLYLCGRLADYRYYNMDQAIERALAVFKQIEQGEKGHVQ